MVYAPMFGSRAATAGLKYAIQWIRTARILKRERPDAVFVMTPPVIAALPAFWYARRYDKQVVLDAHSAAFMHPRWRRLLWLQRALCRHAATTLVHNDHVANSVRQAGGHATLVPDVPVEFANLTRFCRPAGFTVAVVCSFNDDEPVREILRAAGTLPDVSFFMTGDPHYLDVRLAERLPENVHLTGFLSTAAYGGLLTDADAVMALTTRDHTMLRGAYEAIYQGTPVVISDWPLLRRAFPEGAVHVENTAEAIARGVLEIQGNSEKYCTGARRLRESMRERWDATRQSILARVALPPAK